MKNGADNSGFDDAEFRKVIELMLESSVMVSHAPTQEETLLRLHAHFDSVTSKLAIKAKSDDANYQNHLEAYLLHVPRIIKIVSHLYDPSIEVTLNNVRQAIKRGNFRFLAASAA